MNATYINPVKTSLSTNSIVILLISKHIRYQSTLKFFELLRDLLIAMAPIRFGIPLYPYQALDVIGALDILAGISKFLLDQAADAGLGPAGLGVDIEFYHIRDPSTVATSASTRLELENFHVSATTTCADCPPLDYLLFGGPMPTYKLSEEMISFIKDRVAKHEIKIIFSTCTGSAVLAQTGLLDGKRAAVNLGIYDLVQKLYPAVNWVGPDEKTNWIVDGDIWTANSACTGMDMFADWVIQQYGVELGKISFEGLGYAPRGVDGKLLSL
jgi:putative intracellular protease/amidase